MHTNKPSRTSYIDPRAGLYTCVYTYILVRVYVNLHIYYQMLYDAGVVHTKEPFQKVVYTPPRGSIFVRLYVFTGESIVQYEHILLCVCTGSCIRQYAHILQVLYDAGVVHTKEPFQKLVNQVDPKPETRNPKPETRNPKPETRDPRPETREPKPQTPNPEPKTPNLNPKPETPNPRT